MRSNRECKAVRTNGEFTSVGILSEIANSEDIYANQVDVVNLHSVEDGAEGAT